MSSFGLGGMHAQPVYWMITVRGDTEPHAHIFQAQHARCRARHSLVGHAYGSRTMCVRLTGFIRSALFCLFKVYDHTQRCFTKTRITKVPFGTAKYFALATSVIPIGTGTGTGTSSAASTPSGARGGSERDMRGSAPHIDADGWLQFTGHLHWDVLGQNLQSCLRYASLTLPR